MITPKRFVPILLSVVLNSMIFAVDVPLVTKGFEPVEGGDVISEETQFYVSSFDDLYQASNGTDIVELRSFQLLAYIYEDEDEEEIEARVIGCAYEGKHSESGEEFDEGSLVMEIPEDDSFATASGVVGFYRRTGPWQAQPQENTFMFADGTGTVTYNDLRSTRDVDITINGNYNGEAFQVAGESSLRISSEDIVSLDGWDTSEDSDYEFTFTSVVLYRDEQQYTGMMRRSDEEEPEDWTDQFFYVRITDVNDSDGDGIPDFSDLGATETLGILETSSIKIGTDSYWSEDLSTTVFVDTSEFWLYGENLGWFYLPDQNDPDTIRIYIADENLGWLTTNSDRSTYVRESDQAEITFKLIENEVWYYDSATETWYKPDYN